MSLLLTLFLALFQFFTVSDRQTITDTYAYCEETGNGSAQKDESHKTCQKHAWDIVSSQNQKEKKIGNYIFLKENEGTFNEHEAMLHYAITVEHISHILITTMW